MSHTIYVTRIILRPLSALFWLQFMLPMEKSLTFTACTNEIIIYTEWITRSFVNKAKEGGHVRILYIFKDQFRSQLFTYNWL